MDLVHTCNRRGKEFLSVNFLPLLFNRHSWLESFLHIFRFQTDMLTRVLCECDHMAGPYAILRNFFYACYYHNLFYMDFMIDNLLYSPYAILKFFFYACYCHNLFYIDFMTYNLLYIYIYNIWLWWLLARLLQWGYLKYFNWTNYASWIISLRTLYKIQLTHIKINSSRS